MTRAHCRSCQTSVLTSELHSIHAVHHIEAAISHKNDDVRDIGKGKGRETEPSENPDQGFPHPARGRPSPLNRIPHFRQSRGQERPKELGQSAGSPGRGAGRQGGPHTARWPRTAVCTLHQEEGQGEVTHSTVKFINVTHPAGGESCAPHVSGSNPLLQLQPWDQEDTGAASGGPRQKLPCSSDWRLHSTSLLTCRPLGMSSVYNTSPSTKAWSQCSPAHS